MLRPHRERWAGKKKEKTDSLMETSAKVEIKLIPKGPTASLNKKNASNHNPFAGKSMFPKISPINHYIQSGSSKPILNEH